MARPGLDYLTDQHLILFARIIQWFAQYELLMQDVIAKAAGCDAAAVMLMTRSLDFAAKRRVLLDLLRHREVALDRYDRINEFLTVPHTLTPLRNDIAHSAWVPASTEHWIQPDWILHMPREMRPLHSDEIVERQEDTSAYSPEALGEAVARLATNYKAFTGYLRDVGLLAD
jgi:hypothetical protein